MGGLARGIGDAVGGAVKGVSDVVGGAVKGAVDVVKGVGKGAVDLLTLHPGKAIEDVGTGVAKGAGDVVGGAWKGTGEVLHGALSTVKDVVGDPLVMGAAGAILGGIPFGLLGAAAGAGIGIGAGKLGAGITGALDGGVEKIFGVGSADPANQVAQQQTTNEMGPYNGQMTGGCGGQLPYQQPMPPYQTYNPGYNYNYASQVPGEFGGQTPGYYQQQGYQNYNAGGGFAGY